MKSNANIEQSAIIPKTSDNPKVDEMLSENDQSSNMDSDSDCQKKLVRHNPQNMPTSTNEKCKIQIDDKTRKSPSKNSYKIQYEITDSSNQITNDKDNIPVNYRIQKIKNLSNGNNNTLSADTYTYNESGEEIQSLSNSLNSVESGNIIYVNAQKEKADQFVTFFDELSKIQTEDFKDISNQRSLLLEKMQSLLGIIEQYELIIKQEEERRIIVENNDSQIQEQINEFQNQNEILHEEITALLNDKLQENNDEIQDENFYSFILSAFQKVINNYEKQIQSKYIERRQYEFLLQQLEQSISLLSGISNMNDESSKKTYILTQCARIGHYIDEQMNTNCIDNLSNENSFCQFDPQTLIETFFKNMDDQLNNSIEEEENREEEEFAHRKMPYKEIILFFIGVNKINELLSNKNQDLIKENEELKNLLANQNLQIKDYEEWKQKQLENISLIEDTLGYQNSNSEFSLNDVSPETIKYPPEEAIKNLIQVYNDVLSENKILVDDVRKLRKPQEMEQTFDDIKTQFISLERDFTKEKVKFDETVKELVSSIQEKDKTISEHKSVISQLFEKKQKYKEEIKKSYSDINVYQTQISELENQVKTLNEQNESMKQKSANLESNVDQLQNEKTQHQTQLDEVIDSMKIKEKKYKKKILKFKKQLCDIDKVQEENEKKFVKMIETNKKNNQRLKDQIELREKEIESLKNSLNELVGKIKEFQANEQILNSRINLMKKKEEALTTEKDLIKKNSSEKLDFASKKIESMRNSLLTIMKNLFDYEPQQYNISFESLITIFSDILTKNNSQFSNTKIKCDQLNNDLLSIKNENLLLKKEIDKISSRSGSDKKSRVTFEPINLSELHKWEIWAKSLCNRICHYNLTNPNELRFAIEETMMCSIGYKNVYQKLEFLRREKKIFVLLMNQNKNPTNISQSRKIASYSSIHMKSIIFMVIFCGRIRKITGAKAIESIISTNVSIGQSFSESQMKSLDESIFARTNLHYYPS